MECAHQTQLPSIGDFRGEISLVGEIKGFRILMGRIFCVGKGWRALLSFALHLFKKKMFKELAHGLFSTKRKKNNFLPLKFGPKPSIRPYF
jgi:hypothetical protein